MHQATTSIAFFDFDDTISNGDSLWHFLRYSFSPLQISLKLASISPSLILFKLRLMDNNIAKAKLFKAFFSHMTLQEFDNLARNFAAQKIDTLIKPDALERIYWHKQQGHQVVVVSASPVNWLKPWCTKHEIQLIGTQLHHNIAGKITGEFVGGNCYGEEKKRRILKHYPLENYDTIYAYGDSRGDREMLSLADHSYYQYFK